MPALSVIARQYTPVPELVQDPETGYLYRDIKSGSVGMDFTLAKKKEFVAAYRSMFPNLTGACEQAGISRMTYYNHLKLDSAFSQDIKNIKEEKSDKLESVMFEVACMPKPAAFMDRIAMLRAYRPTLYTEKHINLTARDLDPSSLQLKSGTLDRVVDTELCETSSQEPHSVTVIPEVSKTIPEPAQKETPEPKI